MARAWLLCLIITSLFSSWCWSNFQSIQANVFSYSVESSEQAYIADFEIDDDFSQDDLFDGIEAIVSQFEIKTNFESARTHLWVQCSLPDFGNVSGLDRPPRLIFS